MKKLEWKKFSVIGLALSLTLTSTAFASEGNTGNPAETASKTEMQTEKEAEKEENGLESRIFVIEKESGSKTEVLEETEQENQETGRFRKTTLEELENRKRSYFFSDMEVKEMPQTAVVVFQTENFWNQTDVQETEALTEETQAVETVLDTVQQSENMVSGETESDAAAQEEELPVITLTKEQEEQVVKTASLVEETVVVMNGGKLEDELLFKAQKSVKAVLSMNEKTEESFTEAIEHMDLELVYADYQKKIEEESVQTEKKEELNTINKTELHTQQAESVLPGKSLAKATTQQNGSTGTQTPSTSDTEGSTATSGTEESLNVGRNTTTTQKNITITMVPEELLEDEDYLNVVYKLSCPDDVKISEASFKLTYDSTKMSYDEDSGTGEDLDEVDSQGDEDNEITKYTGTDNAGSVTITLKSSDTNVESIKGSILDIWFELKNVAKAGDIYNLKLDVTSMKIGTKELVGDSNYNISVNDNQSIKAVASEDDLNDESESATQPQTQPQTQSESQTQTQTQTQSLQKAAKTDDTTNAALWMLLMAASAGVYVMSKKKKQQINQNQI